jgi:hypothetical protein
VVFVAFRDEVEPDEIEAPMRLKIVYEGICWVTGQ